jgi:hypothetical protein
MADGTANVYSAGTSWWALTSDSGVGTDSAQPFSDTDVQPLLQVADMGDGVVVAVPFTAADVSPSLSLADAGSGVAAVPVFSFGGIIYRYVMRADALDDEEYVAWEADGEPDDAGTYAPEAIVPGTAVVSSYRILLS